MLFQVWTVVGRTDANNILALAILLAAAGILVIGVALERFVAAGSSPILALVVFPYFTSLLTWEHLFSTDLWMVLAFMLSLGLALNGLVMWAVVAALIGVLFKLQGVYWVGVLLFGVAWAYYRRGELKPLLALIGLGAVVFAWYEVHWRTVATRYPQILTVPQDKGFDFPLTWPSLAGIWEKLVWMCNFVSDSYTHAVLHGSWFALAGLLGFLAPLAVKSTRERFGSGAFFGAGYIATGCLLIGTLGWISQYWGVHVFPVALVGISVGMATVLAAFSEGSGTAVDAPASRRSAIPRKRRT